jgi:hypothetical protein
MNCSLCGDNEDWCRYMVSNKVWEAAGFEHDAGWICLYCIQARLDRPLHLDDCTICPLSLWLFYVPGLFNDQRKLVLSDRLCDADVELLQRIQALTIREATRLHGKVAVLAANVHRRDLEGRRS